MEREIWGHPSFEGESEVRTGILGENRAFGWRALPLDAPEWVKVRVAEIRSAYIENRAIEPTPGPADGVELDNWKTEAIRALGLQSFSS